MAQPNENLPLVATFALSNMVYEQAAIPKPCSSMVYFYDILRILHYSILYDDVGVIDGHQPLLTPTIVHLFDHFDIFLVNRGAYVCLRLPDSTIHLYMLRQIPVNFSSILTELWLVYGHWDLPGLNDLLPFLVNLRRINIEHNMMETRDFFNRDIRVIDYCSPHRAGEEPDQAAQDGLALESRIAILRFQQSIEHMTDDPNADLRRFLFIRKEDRPNRVQVIVHLRCPMKLCDTCAKGGTSSMFKRLDEEKFTIRYDLDTIRALSSGWVKKM